MSSSKVITTLKYSHRTKTRYFKFLKKSAILNFQENRHFKFLKIRHFEFFKNEIRHFEISQEFAILNFQK